MKGFEMAQKYWEVEVIVSRKQLGPIGHTMRMTAEKGALYEEKGLVRKIKDAKTAAKNDK